MSKNHLLYMEQYNLLTMYFISVKIRAMRYTYKQFKAEYPDDEVCLKSVLENRYGSTCPKCGVVGVKWHPITGRKGFVCSECDSHIYPLAGTIFRKSSTSLSNWFHAIYLFSVSKNGVSAKELERHLGVTYKTAWRMCKQIRLLMQDDETKLEGPVEVDETYVGGKRKLKHKYENKSVVFGAVERNGRVHSQHVRSNGTRVLIPIIKEKVLPKAQVYSDEARVYQTLKYWGYTHTTINHRDLEYVRGDAHTNTIEGFWSQLKRSIDGTYHAVSPKYLQSYLNEFSFRYNLRDVAICPILLERAVKLS